jgi:hypothetical protein
MPRLKRLFALSITVLVVFLAACGGSSVPQPPDWGVGLDAIAPNGHWGTIVEHSGDPPTCHLTLMKLGEQVGKTYPLNDSTPCSGEGRPQSSFSPDGNYLLYRISNGWGITKTNTPSAPPTMAATAQQRVQFLPNGRLLVISTTNDLTDFFDADPASPITSKNPRLSRVRFIFSVQRSLGASEPSACADPSLSDSAVWVAINADGDIFALVAARNHPTQKLGPLNSAFLTKLVKDTFNLGRERSKQDIKASDKGKLLNEEQLESLLNSPEYATEIALFVRSRLVGTPSPDGTKLLLLYSEKSERGEELYTLKLFNLETGADPLELSTRSVWKPSFTFSPDDRQMLYESNLSPVGGRSLYLVNFDDSDNPHPVARDMVTPCWY